MIKWKRTLDISDIYKSCPSEYIEKDQWAIGAGKKVADRIRSLMRISTNDDLPAILYNIVSDFENIDNIGDFDYAMNELYDWGDFNNECWIKTF